VVPRSPARRVFPPFGFVPAPDDRLNLHDLAISKKRNFDHNRSRIAQSVGHDGKGSACPT
jgi:hypothetical protein